MFWGLKCIEKFLDFVFNIAELEEFANEEINIWAFNGGRFDYTFMLPYLIEKFKNEIELAGTPTLIK